MKKYKFLVKRIKEIEIQISAESHSEALFKMIQKVVKKDENFFTEDLENRKELFIYIEKIIEYILVPNVVESKFIIIVSMLVIAGAQFVAFQFIMQYSRFYIFELNTEDDD